MKTITFALVLFCTSVLASEEVDRNVDRVALAAQELSISKLSSLLKKYSGKQQEPELLIKLGDLQQQKATLLFRVANGKAQHKKSEAVNLDAYHKSLTQAVHTLDILIAKYPHHLEIPLAYAWRGKAYEDLGNRSEAAKDYRHLVQNFPDSERAPSAYMALAEFAIEDGNHALAITYLKELENRPNDPRYPFALYKLAWAHYNLKNIPQALAYAEKQIHFYDDKRARTSKDVDNDITSDTALRESTLLDVPVFYFEGLEEGQSRYSMDDAMAYFSKLDKSHVLGKMEVRFAKLLRSHDRTRELMFWKDQMLDSEYQRGEALEVFNLVYEHLQNKRDTAGMMAMTGGLLSLQKKLGRAKISSNENYSKSQKMILDTATALQETIFKNKQAAQTKEVKAMSAALISLYGNFTQLVPGNDPRIPQIHYNLAESLFTTQDYDGATEHYRWIVEHQKELAPEVAKSVKDASLKAVSARYELLRQKKLIPTEIVAQAIPAASIAAPKLDTILETWIGWVDAVKDDNFTLEANRAIYAAGDIRRALSRLEPFAISKPASSYAIPSLSLALDTYVASGDWDTLLTKAAQYQKVAQWSGTDFGKRLYQLASDSLYKKIEHKYASKDFTGAIADAEAFMHDYPKGAHAVDCLSIAGASALAQGNKDLARTYFTKLIGANPDPDRVGEALLARAAIQESDYDFDSAIADYQAYLVLPLKKTDPKTLDGYRRKILTFTYLSGSPKALKPILKNGGICTTELKSECDKYDALATLTGLENTVPDEDATLKAFNNFRKMNPSDVRTIWAIYALQGAKHLAFRDRNLTLRTIGMGWKDLDPISQFQLIPYLNGAVPQAFEMNRVAMKDVAPLRAKEAYLTHRVDVIHEFENAVAKVMDLPWARIRAGTLNSLASTYQDLANGLNDIGGDHQLVIPFEEKGQEIRSKAFEIASNASIEDEAFAPIQNQFFAENPSQAKKLKSTADESKKGAVMPRGLAYTELSLDYISMLETSKITSLWVRAVKDRNWAKAVFFLQEAKAKNLASATQQSLIRAISLAAIGARGEGLAELDEVRKSATGKLRDASTLTLARDHEKSFAAAKAKELYASFVPAPAVLAEAGDGMDSVKKTGRAPASAKP